MLQRGATAPSPFSRDGKGIIHWIDSLESEKDSRGLSKEKSCIKIA